MAGLKWNTGKLYYSTVELGYQQAALDPIENKLKDQT